MGMGRHRLDAAHARPSPGRAPGSRHSFDSTRGLTILFGGLLTNPLRQAGDTWKWDGNDWTEITFASSPPARDGPAMAYDSGRQVMVLFGGNHMGDISDTWELSGVAASAVIDPQPQSANHCAGQTANFSSRPRALTFPTNGKSVPTAAPTSITSAPVPGALRSRTPPTYSLRTDNGNKYRCVVGVDCGATNSNAATLMVNPATAVTTQPGNANAVIQPAASAPTATFTVVAVGSDLSYQWEQSAAAGATFQPVTTGTGGNSPTYHTAGLTAADTGTKYHCVVTGLCGNTTSNSAKVTVQDASGVSNAVEDGAPNGATVTTTGSPIACRKM